MDIYIRHFLRKNVGNAKIRGKGTNLSLPLSLSLSPFPSDSSSSLKLFSISSGFILFVSVPSLVLINRSM
ncbi:BnaA06g32590D [Brassica napus]|uniref:BnaA06g32590D protein n=1 Tax=Brassica napus TaxID=3708 RepID=A0A078FL67_BRANA|nr:BnaA06g32590D [Brassica napus]